MTDDLSAFLRARLVDDESRLDDGLGGPCEAKGLHLWPDRAKAEVDAKRRILDEYALWVETYAQDRADQHVGTSSGVAALTAVLHLLAVPYADQPGYRDEWRPR